MARMTKQDRYKLAEKLTETTFCYDPYNGLFKDEMLEIDRRDLRTLEGCYLIIDGLCDMLTEAMQ